MQNAKMRLLIALTAGTAAAVSAYAQTDNPEIEPNESKLQATQAFSAGPGLASGDTITGLTQGTSTTASGMANSADYFRIKTAAAPPAIYRHRLTLSTTGTPGHFGGILGLTQSAAGGVLTSLSVVQGSSSTSTPARMNQWYGFGKQEELFYRVTGNSNTGAPYTATLNTTLVSPIIGPTVPPGLLTISTVDLTAIDTDMWVYDANFNAITDFGNDDAPPAASGVRQSLLTRSFAPGTYYLAIGRFNLANNLASPVDDAFRTASVLDFPNAVVGTSTSSPTDISVRIGSTVLQLSEPEAFAVSFVRFVVSGSLTVSCPFPPTAVVEGQDATIALVVSPAPGVPVTSVTVNASSLNPAFTSVQLTDIDNDGTWTGAVPVTALAGYQPALITYRVTDASQNILNGSCDISVLPTPLGACCLGSDCSLISQFACESQGGTFSGPNTDCGQFIIDNAAAPFISIAGQGVPLSTQPLTAGDVDDGRWTVQLPFPFNFAGRVISEVSVSTNGIVQLGPLPLYSTEYNNTSIPDPSEPSSFIAPLWDDLLLTGTSRIDTQVQGPPSSQVFIISYENFTRLTFNDSLNFQIALVQNSGAIELRYGSLTPGAFSSATVGIENLFGNAGLDIATGPLAQGDTSLRLLPTQSLCQHTCDPIDFNNNGVFPEDQDVIDFFNVLSGGPCDNCNDIDFNNNNVFPEDQDIIDFFAVLAGGTC